MPSQVRSAKEVRTLRECYRPDRIRSLLIGIRPPSSRFFYDCTSGGRTISTATRAVFEMVYLRGRTYPGKADFLCDFKARGWFLYDLYDDPDFVEAPLSEGGEAWRRLEALLRAEEPEAVSTIFKNIERPVEDLMRLSDIRPRLVRHLRYARDPLVFKRRLGRLVRDLDGEILS